MNKFTNLIKKSALKLEATRIARELYSTSLAPDFSIFNYIDTTELGLSNILADLLNPKGNHAQKELFLREFFRVCLPDLFKNKQWQPFFADLSNVGIRTEEQTTEIGSKRRMDIYLFHQNRMFGICIENKPYAADQERQLSDHNDELHKRHGDNRHLIYLNEYNSPSENSINGKQLTELKKNGSFDHLTYSNLVEWLNSCIAKIQNDSVVEFIRQLIKFIQKKFSGISDMNEQNELLEIMLSDSNSIEASIKISLNILEMKKKLIQKLLDDLSSLSSGKGYKLDTTIEQLTGKKCEEKFIFKLPNKEKEYAICFEFEATAFNLPCLGIRFFNGGPSPLFNQLYEIFTQKSKPYFSNPLRIENSEYWPAWYWFDETGNNTKWDWFNDVKPWKMIQTDQQMAKKIIEEVDVFYKFLQENQLV